MAKILALPIKAPSKFSFEKAIEHDDSTADAFCNLGIIESKSGQNNEAFDCFTRSIAEDPRHLESHYNLSNLYFDIGNLGLAHEHYEIAAKLDPISRIFTSISALCMP